MSNFSLYFGPYFPYLDILIGIKISQYSLLFSDPDSRVDDLDVLEASHPEIFEAPLRTGKELVEAFQSIAQQISDSFIQEFDESQTRDGMMLVLIYPLLHPHISTHLYLKFLE